MTKEEYGEVRDIFTTALKALRDVEEVFCETPHSFPIGAELHDLLNDGGYWLTGHEYLQLNDAMALLEVLIGRAHERSAA